MADPGEGPGGGPPPLILRPSKLKKNLETAPHPLSQGLHPVLTQVLQFPSETIVFSATSCVPETNLIIGAVFYLVINNYLHFIS